MSYKSESFKKRNVSTIATPSPPPPLTTTTITTKHYNLQPRSNEAILRQHYQLLLGLQQKQQLEQQLLHINKSLKTPSNQPLPSSSSSFFVSLPPLPPSTTKHSSTIHPLSGHSKIRTHLSNLYPSPPTNLFAHYKQQNTSCPTSPSTQTFFVKSPWGQDDDGGSGGGGTREISGRFDGIERGRVEDGDGGIKNKGNQIEEEKLIKKSVINNKEKQKEKVTAVKSFPKKVEKVKIHVVKSEPQQNKKSSASQSNKAPPLMLRKPVDGGENVMENKNDQLCDIQNLVQQLSLMEQKVLSKYQQDTLPEVQLSNVEENKKNVINNNNYSNNNIKHIIDNNKNEERNTSKRSNNMNISLCEQTVSPTPTPSNTITLTTSSSTIMATTTTTIMPSTTISSSTTIPTIILTTTPPKNTESGMNTTLEAFSTYNPPNKTSVPRMVNNVKLSNVMVGSILVDNIEENCNKNNNNNNNYNDNNNNYNDNNNNVDKDGNKDDNINNSRGSDEYRNRDSKENNGESANDTEINEFVGNHSQNFPKCTEINKENRTNKKDNSEKNKNKKADTGSKTKENIDLKKVCIKSVETGRQPKEDEINISMVKLKVHSDHQQDGLTLERTGKRKKEKRHSLSSSPFNIRKHFNFSEFKIRHDTPKVNQDSDDPLKHNTLSKKFLTLFSPKESSLHQGKRQKSMEILKTKVFGSNSSVSTLTPPARRRGNEALKPPPIQPLTSEASYGLGLVERGNKRVEDSTCNTNSLVSNTNVQQPTNYHQVSPPITYLHHTTYPHQPTHPPKPPIVIVAIDFGTTYSGYAFTFVNDPQSVHVMRKWDGEDPGVVNQKTATNLLLRPDGSFHSFGFTARDYYHDLEASESRGWMFFDKFKMVLHAEAHLNHQTTIKSTNGIVYPAFLVFVHALRYFRNHALQQLSDQSETAIWPKDVRWVITVPAIWRGPAKQFMREAAHKAGMHAEQVLIALEPEAASIYVRSLKTYQLVTPPSTTLLTSTTTPTTHDDEDKDSTNPTKLSPSFLTLNKNNIKNDTPSYKSLPNRHYTPIKTTVGHQVDKDGTRYMLVDCGGGTVDITVHEIEKGRLKELHRASGGPFGSVGIDGEFENLLRKLFTWDFILSYKSTHPSGWVDLMASWEARKRSVTIDKQQAYNISLPFSFIKNYRKVKGGSVEGAIKRAGMEGVAWSNQGMLRVQPQIMLRMFQKCLNSIVQAIADVINHPNSKGVTFLFLVGGFAESQVLQNEVRSKFKDHVTVLIPQDVSTTIMKGAVQFGLDPRVVQERKSPLTYGVAVLNRFLPGVHPEHKALHKAGVKWCKDIFDVFVTANQTVQYGERVVRRYTEAESGQKQCVMIIYSCEEEKVVYVDEGGVVKCGCIVLECGGEGEGLEDIIPDTRGIQEDTKEIQEDIKGIQAKNRLREIEVSMTFGDTEIKVDAKDVSNNSSVVAYVDFMGR